MVLDKGEIKEIGSHRELMEKEGLYYQLYKTQFPRHQ
jgi:ATP-binding cassette subfamily B protein